MTYDDIKTETPPDASRRHASRQFREAKGGTPRKGCPLPTVAPPASNFYAATDSALAELKLIEAEIERLEDRRKEIRSGLAAAIASTDDRALTRPLAKVALQDGKQSLKVDDPAKLPKELTRVVVEPDKPAIIALIESGRPVPGCTLSHGEPFVVVRWTKGV